MGRPSYERWRKFIDDPSDKRHGTTTGYGYGCRCERCLEAGRKAANERYRKKCEKQHAKAKPKRVIKDTCTVNDLYKPLMGRPSISNANDTCCWCGAPGATNHHHIVPRSAGKLVVDGREVPKPTVLLCGMGNASGCHGKAHQHLLHFRWHEPERTSTENWEKHPVGCGYIEGIETDEPMKYQEALAIKKGWRRV